MISDHEHPRRALKRQLASLGAAVERLAAAFSASEGERKAAEQRASDLQVEQLRRMGELEREVAAATEGGAVANAARTDLGPQAAAPRSVAPLEQSDGEPGAGATIGGKGAPSQGGCRTSDGVKQPSGRAAAGVVSPPQPPADSSTGTALPSVNSFATSAPAASAPAATAPSAAPSTAKQRTPSRPPCSTSSRSGAADSASRGQRYSKAALERAQKRSPPTTPK